MTSQFSYQSLRCVLEYLEANKRIHICARSKSFQKIDKTIPLHVNHLNFQHGQFKLNRACFSFLGNTKGRLGSDEVYADGAFRSWKVVLTPGDISLNNFLTCYVTNLESIRVRNVEFAEVKYIGNGRSVNSTIRISWELAQKIMINKLFGQRGTIYVSSLEVNRCIVRLPEFIKFRITSSLDMSLFDFTNLLPIIHPLSIPLKSIAVDPWKPEMYDHPIVQNAETINIYSLVDMDFLEPWHRQVLTLPHKHINVESYDFNEEQLIVVIQEWLTNPRKVGNSFTAWVEQNVGEGILELFDSIRTRFNGTWVQLPTDANEERICCTAVSIPLNCTSELIVCVLLNGKMMIKVIPTTQTIGHRASYQDLCPFCNCRNEDYEYWAIGAIAACFVFLILYDRSRL